MNQQAQKLSQQPVQKPGDIFSREEIRSLSTRSDLKGWWLILHCWTVILLTWLVCIEWTNPLTVVLGIMVIGTRQLGLGIISHDAAHHLLLSDRKLNDQVAEWLLNRPLMGASVVPYRNYHFVHHRFTQQEQDPDLILSKPFPTSKASLKRKIIRDLTGQTGWKQKSAEVRSAFVSDGRLDMAAGLRRYGPNLMINAAFLAFFALMGKWYLYFLLWVVPHLTWHLLVSRIRNIGEHGAVPDNGDRLRNTRTTRANLLERAFLAPYYVNFHLEHHLLMSCPCYNLPKAHEMLVSKGMLGHMEVQPGYQAVLRVAAPA
ncbi:MAG: fatty acid desaturase family protein [Pseudomonadales bacterium]|nr:fatty acid desaturase family protein [Pseudomonadales bacterium]